MLCAAPTMISSYSVTTDITGRQKRNVLSGKINSDYIHLTLANDQLDAQILTHLLQSSTCFEQYLAPPQEVKLY